MKKKALFIDRDGTIIREPEDEQIDSLEKLEFVPGAIGALSILMRSGEFELVLATNQDGLGTPSFPEKDFTIPHLKMIDTLKGEGIEFTDQLIDRSFPYENLPTRKPGIGMFGDYLTGDYELEHSYVIGDRHTDIQLARNLGAKAIMIGTPENGKDADFCSESWMEIADFILRSERRCTIHRDTRETSINITLDLDGLGSFNGDISTGLGFFDHMLAQIAHHSGLALSVNVKGDLHVDEHHTVEDTAIALGEAVARALGSKAGIERYGFALPMDDCRALVLLDFGGRADFEWDVKFNREYVGDVPTELWSHFFKSFAHEASCNLYISARGDNDHHRIEAIFKAFARTLGRAVHRIPFKYTIPSSKGVI